MGAEFIFSVISTLTGLLSSLRSSGATSAGGEGDGIARDLDRLERLLRRIQAALRDAGEREIRDEYVMLWLKELKTVAYEAEDILDEWQYEIMRHQIEESEESSSSLPDGKELKRLEGFIPDGMAKKIKIVIEQFEEISKDRDALSLREDDGEMRGSVWTGMLPTSHLVNESAIFGRDEDKKKVLDFVLSDDTGRKNPISVLAIVGMGGVGKTTLAQLVYNDCQVQNHFDLRAWIYVSLDFDFIRLTNEILESINLEYVGGGLRGLSAAQAALVVAVTEKKLFIVLDDVWNESPSKWEQFLEPFRAAEFVKIVMTTRNETVALKIGITETYNLSCLSEKQSGLLFEHYVYGGQFIDADSRLKSIGVQIIKKCAGLPLAIKSIGRVLSYKADEDSWRHILESELWESDGKDEIFPALKVSYYSLPSAMKPCFLFCSLFPKGSVLEMNQIIYMWIAHDYIQPCGGRSAEDIGNEFILELCRRSFLTKNNDGKQRESFSMHDMMHDLAKSISTDEIRTINKENVGDTYTGVVYHTYTEGYGVNKILSSHGSLMRTVICNVAWYIFGFADLQYHSYEPMCINLRVFKCEGVHMRDLEHMANYKHLRYLELNRCQIERLPESLPLLYNLVALQLRSLELMELSINFGKLINLRLLAIDWLPIRDLPESLGRLSNLQYLSVSYCTFLDKLPSSIGNLISLKQLYISGLNVRELPESFCMLQNLQTLSVYRCWRIRQIPSGIGDLTNLQRIYFGGIGIETLPKSMNYICNLKTLELSCSGCPVSLLLGFERLLSKSSLNFLVKRFDGRIQDSCQIKEDPCKYVKTQRLMESLQPVSDLVRFKINGYVGVGYAFSNNLPSVTAIALHCHVKSGNFFSELGELPSLKSLSLVRITGVQNLQLNIPQSSTRDTSKVRFPSLEELELVDLREWSGSVGNRDRDFPVLESLKIENCPKLSSVPNFGNNLRRLEIIRCSLSKLELDLLDMPLLESLIIGECIQLTLIKGLQSLNSLQALCVFRCPLLRDFVYRKMPKSPLSIEIVECPSMKDWCQIQQFSYKKVYSGAVNTLNLSQNVLVEHPGIQNCIKLDECLYSLTMLKTRSCWKIEKLDWINLKLPRSSFLWDCPLLQLKNFSNTASRLHKVGARNNSETINCGGSAKIRLLPSVQSLVFHRCHKMLSLNLSVEDGSSLIELKITDCKRLKYITGLQQFRNLETLTLVQCPQLLLQTLDSVPKHVVISRCPRLKGWCKWHSVEPIDEEVKLST